MAEPTRVEAGRRRAQLAKRTVSVTAATGFAVALALVRQGHPATAHSSSPHVTVSRHTRPAYSEDDGGSTIGGGSIAPPSSAPAPVATATS